jgi:UDP-N-acetylmuramate--alanine ligase
MKYHFVGIKGSGMSALAQIMNDLGNEVQGSDITEHLFTQEPLEARGIKLLPFDANNITKDMNIIVGNAFKDDHIEVVRAKELGLKIERYFDVLSSLTKRFKTIAISGCHGKTTTTGLISHVFDKIVGCNYLIGDGTGYADFRNEYFMLEACEYKRTFLHYYPTITIITNIELDHVDYYKDIDDVILAFQQFVNQTKDIVFACGDNENVHKVTYEKVKFYGFNDDNDIVAKNIELTKDGSNFDVYIDKEFIGHFDLPLYGKHMVLNALSVIGVSHYIGLDIELVMNHLKTFKGVKRRFKETIIDDIITIDDYAHHPTEVRVTIEAARQKYPDKEIVAIFKPNTYTRTRDLATDFVKVLDLADKAYVTDIFCDREQACDYPGITSDIIISRLRNGEHIGMESIDKLLRHENAVLVFMSCKNIYALREAYEDKLKEKKGLI